MIKQNRLIFGIFFLAVLMLGLVSAAADNTSIMYGQNASGAMIPLQTTDDGTLKVEMDLMNITTGGITASGNLSLGQKITFAFGEVIDNIADGWIRVTGGLNVTSGNFSLGGKILSNYNGTLKWGGVDIDSNISVLYGTNSSGDVQGLSVDNSGILNMNIVGASSNIWEVVSDVVQLVNVQNVTVNSFFTASSNGVGIGSDISKDSNYTLVSADRNRLVILNSSAGGHTNFTLPAGTGGEIYRILNDAEYILTVKPTGTDAIWNSGNGYGIDLPDKGTMVELRYSSSRGKWDILQKTGGKVLIEGLKLYEPMNKLNPYSVDSTNSMTLPDVTGKHSAYGMNNINAYVENVCKFSPGCFYFPGVDEYMLYQDSNDWDIFGTNETGHKTVAFWVWHGVTATEDEYFSQDENATTYIRFMRYTDHHVYADFRSGTLQARVSSSALSDETWHHIAIVIDGSNLGLYINGTYIGRDESWNTGTIDGNLQIGKSTLTGNYFTGRMQDLHVSYNNPYNVNVSAGEDFTIPAAPFRGVME